MGMTDRENKLSKARGKFGCGRAKVALTAAHNFGGPYGTSTFNLQGFFLLTTLQKYFNFKMNMEIAEMALCVYS